MSRASPGPWSPPLVCREDRSKGSSCHRGTRSVNPPSIKRIVHMNTLARAKVVQIYTVLGWSSASASATFPAPCTVPGPYIVGSLMFLNELKNRNAELAFCLLILMLGLCPTFQNQENHPDGIHLNKKRKKIPLVNF